MKKKIGYREIKQALNDGRFRDRLPVELKDHVAKYLHNPGCNCNRPFYVKLIKEYPSYLLEYFTDYELPEVAELPDKNVEMNDWTVINCHIDDLEKELSKLPMGRKQIATARFQDQITCVVNSLE